MAEDNGSLIVVMEDGSEVEIPASRVKHAKLKANGADRDLDGAAFFANAQKGFGADEAFRKASELRKQTEEREAQLADATETLQALQKFKKDKDPQAFLRVAKAMGVTAIEATNIWNAMSGQASTEEDEGEGTVQRRVNLNDLPPEVREAVEGWSRLKETGVDPARVVRLSASSLEQQAEERAKAMLKTHLSKNPVLARIVKRGTDSESVLVNRLYRELKNRVDNGERLQKALDEVIADEATTAEAYGINEQPASNPFPGLWPVGSAPANGRGVRIQDGKPPVLDSRDITKKGSVASFTDALMGHLAQEEGGPLGM